MKNISSWHALVGVALVVYGCSDNDGGDSTTSAASSLIAFANEPVGSNCVAGGTRITSGLDANGDSVLDSSEVLDTQFVCTPGANPASLVLIDAELPGAYCEHGGSRMRAGLDDNGDGVLDNAEVDSTDYLCGDGVPEDGSLLTTIYVGTVRIESQADADALSGYRVVYGDVLISPFAAQDLVIDGISAVIGTIVYDDCRFGSGPSMVETLSFPALSYSSELWFPGCDDTLLEVVSLPVLTAVDGLVFESMLALTQVDAPLLNTASFVGLWGNESLLSVELPSLRELGGLEVSRNAVLDEPFLAHLEHLEYLYFSQVNPTISCLAYGFANLVEETTGQDNYELGELSCDDGQLVCPASSALAALGGDYRMCFVRRTWDAGQTLCQSIGNGYDLATFSSEEDFLAFMAVRDNTGVAGGDVWIGYNDLAEEGTWAWTSSSAYQTDLNPDSSDSFWNDGEPNNSEDDEHCAHLGGEGVNDNRCSNEYRVLCRHHD